MSDEFWIALTDLCMNFSEKMQVNTLTEYEMQLYEQGSTLLKKHYEFLSLQLDTMILDEEEKLRKRQLRLEGELDDDEDPEDESN
jgi:hypothetical protein